MSLQNFQTGINSSCNWNWSLSQNCDTSGCSTCPDLTIKRHDTRPPLKVEVQECDPTIDWTDTQLVLEASIWFNAKIKTAIAVDTTSFALADNVGYDQFLPEDIVLVGGPRSPEMMVVTGFDEVAKTVTVSRAYHGTTARAWAKGTKIMVFRALNAPATIENVHEDVLQEDGTTLEDQLTGSYLVYEWSPSDTCLPGCFLREYKLLRMMPDPADDELPAGDGDISRVSVVMADYGCTNGLGVDWVRRFPADKPGFLVQVIDSISGE